MIVLFDILGDFQVCCDRRILGHNKKKVKVQMTQTNCCMKVWEDLKLPYNCFLTNVLSKLGSNGCQGDN